MIYNARVIFPLHKSNFSRYGENEVFVGNPCVLSKFTEHTQIVHVCINNISDINKNHGYQYLMLLNGHVTIKRI